jgi:hypothetical protein
LIVHQRETLLKPRARQEPLKTVRDARFPQRA